MNERQASIRLSRALRSNHSDVERKLWDLLRGRRLAALKWRRQVSLGRYIVDFACLERRLIVELDGSQHADS